MMKVIELGRNDLTPQFKAINEKQQKSKRIPLQSKFKK